MKENKEEKQELTSDDLVEICQELNRAFDYVDPNHVFTKSGTHIEVLPDDRTAEELIAEFKRKALERFSAKLDSRSLWVWDA